MMPMCDQPRAAPLPSARPMRKLAIRVCSWGYLGAAAALLLGPFAQNALQVAGKLAVRRLDQIVRQLGRHFRPHTFGQCLAQVAERRRRRHDDKLVEPLFRQLGLENVGDPLGELAFQLPVRIGPALNGMARVAAGFCSRGPGGRSRAHD